VDGIGSVQRDQREQDGCAPGHLRHRISSM